MSDDARHDDHMRHETAREAITMALYQALSILAVLLASPTPADTESGAAVAVAVLLTGLGLLAAHHVAFRLSTRVVDRGLVGEDSSRLLRAQAIGGLPIVVAAAVPPLILGPSVGTTVSEVLLILLVALVGYRAVRQAVDRPRALGYLVGLLVTISAVMLLKTAVGH